MNVTVENLAACKKMLRVDVEAEKVDKMFEEVTRGFIREANFPGFRPGKAPREMVERKYAGDIRDEVKRKLISDSYKQALTEKDVEVLGYPEIEEVEFERGKALQFIAKVETPPEFEVPEYKNIPVQRETQSVTDEDVAKALDALRQPRTTFQTVERSLATGDIAVVNYTGTCEGKSILEIAPTAKGLTEQKGFWVEAGANTFIPGFADQLMGAKAGDKRTVTVDFPADFVAPQLAGKKGEYAVEVVEVKEKVLPAIDDEFAKSYGAESLEKLREGVLADLQNELTFKQNRTVRSQLIRSLLNRVSFELPESSVARETKNVVYDLVQENARRGITRQTIEEQKEKIYTAAAQGAKERVTVAFILQKIAEKEDIKVSQEEISSRVVSMAGMYKMPVEKFVKDLQKRNGFIEIYDQVMNEKVIDFLQQHAKIEDVLPGQTPQA